MSYLVVRRQQGETWRQAVERIAGKQGLAHECLEIFDEEVARGIDPGDAAFGALYERDCCDCEPDQPTLDGQNGQEAG